MKKALLVLLCFIALLCGATALFNETPFMYKTPLSYVDARADELARPEYGPINIENRKSDSAIIFLAGFKGTPAQFLYFADTFKKEYNVICPLYPGSGTTPEKYMRTYYTQWYAKARDTYLEARKKFRHVYLCGFSMGGTIALKLAEEFGPDAQLKPDKVISISGLVFLNNLIEEQYIYDWRLYLVRFLSWYTPYIKKGRNPDNDVAPGPASYDEADYLKQVYSFKMGMLEAKEGLSGITAPLLLMQAKGDTISPYLNLYYIAQHVSSNIVKARAFDLSGAEYTKRTRHFLPHYPGTRDAVIEEIKSFLK